MYIKFVFSNGSTELFPGGSVFRGNGGEHEIDRLYNCKHYGEFWRGDRRNIREIAKALEDL